MSVCAGCDLGYGNTKLAWSLERGALLPITRILPSGSSPIWSLPSKPDGKPDLCGGPEVTVDGEPWVGGVESHRLENYTREHSEAFTSSREWTALLHAALVQIGAPKIDILVAGLPVTEFYAGDKRVKLKARLEGVHQVRSGQIVEVARAVIVPQPIGAYADHVHSSKAAGRSVGGPDHMTLVLDSGHYSVDWVCLLGSSVRAQSSSSSAQAGRQILVTTTKHIFEQTGLRVSLDRLEAAVRRGETTMLVGSTELRFTPYLERGAVQVISQVLKEVSASIGPQRDQINTVILTGGGATLFRPLVSRALPQAELVIADAPVLGNARGFWATGRGSSNG